MKALEPVLCLAIAVSLVSGCGDVPDPTAPNQPIAAAPPAAAVYDTAYDLTLASSGQQGQAYDLSANGIVVGQQDGQPFTWQAHLGRGGPLPLPAGFSEGGAAAISQDGVWIAGWAGSVLTHAVLWDKGGRPLDLGTLGGAQSWATGVNAAGNVVGWSETVRSIRHAFFYDQAAGRLIDLGLPPGSLRTAESFAFAITDKGEVVGCSQRSAAGGFRMFRWTAGGGMVDLGAPAGDDACALAVNASGTIAGWASSGGVAIGMTWTATTGFIFHRTGAAGSSAQDLNLSGLSAGYDVGSFSGYVADRRGSVTFLRNLGWGLSFARALNDCGDVVGFGSGSATHAVLWPSGSCP